MVMETLLGLMVGIGLSAAGGFRVFVPLLGLSIASMTGYINLSSGFEWIGTWPAIISFGTATILEIGAYFIPWLDNLMDTITAPAAIIAGTLMTASVVGDIPPFFKWVLAIIAGGGTSGIVHLGTATMRGTSSATTAGLGNFLVSTIELIGSILTTFLAVVLPLLCLLLVIWICYKMIKLIKASPVFKKSA
jgi:hypothetical protein